MLNFAIRSRADRAVSPDELERWLGRQVEDLRTDVPGISACLSRLSNGEQCHDEGRIGWWLELDLPEADGPLVADRVDEMVRDMRLLGLHAVPMAPAPVDRGRIVTSAPAT